MKQFMTASAFFLSAACLCVHSPSFAQSQSSTTNKVVNGTNAVIGVTADVAKSVVNGGATAVSGAAKGTASGIDQIVQGVKKGTDRMLGHHSCSKKSSKNKHSKHTNKTNTNANESTMPYKGQSVQTINPPSSNSMEQAAPASDSSKAGSSRQLLTQ